MKHSTFGPSGGRGNDATSCKSGNFHVVSLVQMSEPEYLVQVAPANASQASRVNDTLYNVGKLSTVPKSRESLAQAWKTFCVMVHRFVKSNPLLLLQVAPQGCAQS